MSTTRRFSPQDQWPASTDERGAAMACTTDPTSIIDAPCARRSALPAARRKPSAGFTLIEMLVAVAVAGVLSSVAYPSFAGQVYKARRADVLVSMMQVQLAQERWRSNNPGYGDLAQIGVASVSTAGHYQLRITRRAVDGYQMLATATGTQAGDRGCSHLQVTVDGANVTQASGSDATVANSTADNRRCWNL